MQEYKFTEIELPECFWYMDADDQWRIIKEIEPCQKCTKDRGCRNWTEREAIYNCKPFYEYRYILDKLSFGW